MSNYKYKNSTLTLFLGLTQGDNGWGVLTSEDPTDGKRVWSGTGLIDDVGESTDASASLTVSVEIKAPKTDFGSLAVSSAGAAWAEGDPDDDDYWIQTSSVTLEPGIQQEDLKFTVTPTAKGETPTGWKASLDPYVRVRRKGYSFGG